MRRFPGIRRRGSILVLVIGTLALMATLAALYASIGAGDRHTSRAVVQRDRLDDVPERARDHVAGVIARDVLSVFPAPTGVTGGGGGGGGDVQYGLRRETWDYPWTDPMMESQPGGGNAASSPRRFRPEGSYPVWPDDAALQRSLVGSDPWLASEDPVNLDPEDDQATSPGDPRRWLDRRDWAQMSNFAPDGRAVNLFNLRNNLDAASGFESGPDGLPGISANLSVYDADGQPISVNGATIIGSNDAGDENVPAHLFTNQRFAVRASEDDAETTGWNDRFFPRYQYADADGDGMLDSRWQELVDATNENNPASLIETPDNMRFFFAFRAVDLSARANVNTAIDFTVEPDEEYRAGHTPGDVDLRRLLALEDPETVADPEADPPTFDLYNMLDQPRDAGGTIANPGDPRFAENYQGYAYETGMAPQPRISVGDGAYDYLRYTLERGVIPPESVFADLGGNDLLNEFDMNNFGDFTSDPPLTDLYENHQNGQWEATAEGRSTLYRESGAARLGASFSENGGNEFYTNSFSLGADSLRDLLTYNGVNDPASLSPLEAIVGGRFAESGNADDLFRRFDPLRSNRSLAVERGSRDGYDAIRGEENPDGVTDLDAYAHMLADVRHRLTTLSGARPLRSSIVVADPQGLSSQQLRREIGSLDQSADAEGKHALEDVVGSVSGAFSLYMDALAPALPDIAASGNQDLIDAAWDPDADDWPHLRTLFYGYRGADAAARMAAHMAVNLSDMGDGQNDTSPSARTLPLVKSAGFVESEPWVIKDSGGSTARLLQIPDAQLPNDAANVNPQGVNIYGVEPQPFVTEVGSMFVYTDAPTAAGGDDETRQEGVGGDPPFDGPDFIEPFVTMDSDIEADNPDFLMAAIAVQLTNPFDTNLTSDLSQYYLELRLGSGSTTSRYYPISGTEGETLSLDPGQTQTVVLLSESLGAVEQKFQDVDSDGVLDDGFVREFLDRQFQDADSGQEGVVILGAGSTDRTSLGGDPLAGLRDEFADESAFDAEQVRLWRTAGADARPEQDLMADRLRVPDDASLDRALDLQKNNSDDVGSGAPRTGVPSGQHLIDGATAADETSTDSENYNQGLTVVTWASARRPDDPDGDTRPERAFPAWAIEARWAGAAESLNASDEDVLPDGVVGENGRLEDNDFPDMLDGGPDTDAEAWTFRTVEAFAERVVGGSAVGASRMLTVDQHPDDKSGEPIGVNLQTIALDDLRAEMYTTLGEDEDGNDEPRRAGVAGLLLPLAVGPEMDPGDMPASTDDDEWLTLSESLALALNYDNPPDDDPSAPFTHYAALSTGTPESNFGGQPQGWPTTARSGNDAVNPGQPVARGAVDRGHLVLDDFVPFLDQGAAADAGTAPNRFDPGADAIYGLGITPAMRILASVSGLDSTLAGPNGVVPGLININTATRPVARAVPMLSPSRDSWWWDMTHNDTSDIATTLLAYRDQSPLGTISPRPSSGASPPDDFELTFAGDFEPDGQNNQPIRPGTTGRQLATVIPGLRKDTGPNAANRAADTTPGLRSTGELLAARIHNADQGYNPTTSNTALHNIDRLGRDDSGVDRDGVDPVRYDPDEGDPDDEIDDDYDEQLALINAALNTTTDRTDYVAVWFVMHGYRESDVTGLDGDDPLVPSIARRYLMVVDRSGVTSLGDEAEVVLFEEVPM